MHVIRMLPILVAATLAAPVLAQQEPGSGSWHIVFEPYFMAPNMDGSSGVGPLTARVSANPSDIFSNLNWGVMGQLEVNNGRFGLNFDGTYMNLESTSDRRFLDSIGGHQGAYTFSALMRIEKHAELYAGVRVNDLGVNLSATGPLGNPRSASGSKTWVDPIVGLRVTLPFSRTTDLTTLVDVGGFGISSDISVQVWPSIGFRLSDKTRIKLGYRAVYTKYESGEGLQRFSYDVLTFGPTAGVRFQF